MEMAQTRGTDLVPTLFLGEFVSYLMSLSLSSIISNTEMLRHSWRD